MLVVVLAIALGAALGGPASFARADDHLPDRLPVRPAAVTRTIPDTVRFDQDFTDNNLVKLTVTNYGFYGNNFFSRQASLEYPANRGYEHLVRGGLWVGAKARDDNGVEFIGVTAGTVDANQGVASPNASEFTPGTMQVFKYSTQPGSEFYDPIRAVSELDVVSDFNDLSPQAVQNSEPHRPLRISVHHENFQWNFADLKNILFFRITVRNLGPLMKDVWMGIYTELASGFKDGYVNWPPSSTDPGGLGSYFSKKWIVFDDSLRLEREHYCASGVQPLPSKCRLEVAPYWIGLRYLGERPLQEDTTSKQVTAAAWAWAPGNVKRDQDGERYLIMNGTTIQRFDADSLLPGAGDPVEVLSAGPFPFLYNDSTVTVNFAIVGAGDVPTIQRYSKLAQFVYDNNYRPPVPPPPPRHFHIAARDTALDFFWDDSSETTIDPTDPDTLHMDFEGYRLYIGEDPDTMARVAEFDIASDTTGFNTGFGAVTQNPMPRIDGVDYKYKFTVRGLRNGFKYYCAVTSFDRGNPQIESLEGGVGSLNRLPAIPGPAPNEMPSQSPTVFPNPYRVEARWDTHRLVRDHYLWFANLPERCTLRIYTLSGDRVFEKSFDGTTYQGEGARGIYDPSKGLGKPTLSGAMYGWNMISTEGQAIATGLYLYSVESSSGGKPFVGKFLIVKSDRETLR
jgi:hypothetical protein